MSYTSFSATPLTGVIGARIDGLDLRQELTDQQQVELRQALDDHLVLFFREQDLTEEEHLRFATTWGKPNIYPATKARGLDQPLEFIEDTPDSPPKADVWHTDAAYLQQPPEVAVLCMLDTPAVGGDTLFVNLYALYDSFAPHVRELFDTVVQHTHPGQSFKEKMILQFGEGIYELVAEEFSGAYHPLVRVHPNTGRKALYLTGSYFDRLEGMAADESDAIYGLAHSRVSDPNFACRWQWQLHDVSVWDERCTNHRAVGDHHGHHRLVRRCTLGDGITIGPDGPTADYA